MAVVALAVVGVATYSFAEGASAAEHTRLHVTPRASAHGAYGPLLCCSKNADSSFGANAPRYAAPTECSAPTQRTCDAIPIEISGDPRPGAIARVVVHWSDPGVLLRVSLWARNGPKHDLIEANLATSANGPGPVNLDGSNGGALAVYDLHPHAQRVYELVVENALGATGADPNGYRVDASVESDPGWRLDDDAARTLPVQSGRAPTPRLTTVDPTSPDPSTFVDPSARELPNRGLRVSPLRAMRHTRRASRGLGALTPFVLTVLALAALAAFVFGPRRRRLVSQGASMRARLASRFANLRLFWKLLVPFVAVILVIGLSGAYLTVHYLASRASTTLDQSLLERSVGAETYLRDSELYLLEAERFAANLEGVPEATAAHNASDLSRALASAVAVRKDLDVLAATDAAGLGLVDYVAEAGTFAAHAGTQWSAAPAVAQVLSGVVDATGDKRTSLVRLGDSSVLLLTAGPIRTDAVVGAAVAGISAEKLAAGAARRARGRVALYDPSGARMAASRGGLAARLPAGATRGAPLRTRHGGIATLYSPLVIRGARVGTVATAIPTGGAFSSVRGAAMRLALLVALAMAAIVGFGVAVSRSILRSVEPLVATNRALGAGDLSVRAPVRGGDELGELASGFNLMAEQLQASYGELERRVEERTEELSRLYADNVRATEARSQFFATISHEFRTPLFAILANAELMADPALGPATPAELAESTATISTSARVLLERVNEILELASAESTGIDINVAPLDMAETWADLEPTVAALARAGELDLTSSVPTDLPPVAADDTRLRQIISNLASNAVKYTPAGGRVAVSARLHGDVVEVAVTDTGVGIPRSVGDKVFEPYYRVKGSRAQGNWASTGLGLALTRRLVEAHGGRIWFRSARPGTTFFFTLPVAAKPTRAKARRG
jgi:signal transduction histidine kinase